MLRGPVLLHTSAGAAESALRAGRHVVVVVRVGVVAALVAVRAWALAVGSNVAVRVL